MLPKFRRNKSSEYLKNILTLLKGTVISQLIVLGISPILTRLYSPNDFGIFAFYSSIFAITALISGGRYENAIIIPKKQNRAANLLLLSIIINVLFFIAFYCILFVVSFFIQSKTLWTWYYLLPVITLLIGITQTLNVWYNRKKEYKKIVFGRVTNSIFNSSFSLFFGVIKINLNGLLSSFVIAQIASLGLFFYLLRKDLKIIKASFSKKLIIQLAKKYKNFPLYNSFQALLDAFQINGIIYLISYFYGAFYVGIFSLAIRILFLPMNFIGTSIAQVFYQNINELIHENKEIKTTIQKTIRNSLFLFLPVCIIILFLGPKLFSFVFGIIWEESGIYAQILVVWFMFDFIRAPISQLPLIIDKQKHMMFFSLISNLAIMLVFIFCNYLKISLIYTLIYVSISQSFYIVLLLFWIYKLAKRVDSNSL